tara:strand:- start:244 stop:483 length:240 start_codon:yes stop_codon:yes gene_type:complete
VEAEDPILYFLGRKINVIFQNEQPEHHLVRLEILLSKIHVKPSLQERKDCTNYGAAGSPFQRKRILSVKETHGDQRKKE